MRKKAPNEEGSLPGINSKPYQAIPFVEETAVEEIFIAREEGRSLQP